MTTRERAIKALSRALGPGLARCPTCGFALAAAADEHWFCLCLDPPEPGAVLHGRRAVPFSPPGASTKMVRVDAEAALSALDDAGLAVVEKMRRVERPGLDGYWWGRLRTSGEWIPVDACAKDEAFDCYVGPLPEPPEE